MPSLKASEQGSGEELKLSSESLAALDSFYEEEAQVLKQVSIYMGCVPSKEHG